MPVDDPSPPLPFPTAFPSHRPAPDVDGRLKMSRAPDGGKLPPQETDAVVFGLADDAFLCRHPHDDAGTNGATDASQPRGGLITKFEARAVSLAKLALGRRSIVWDVGAGSGSVGIEAARIAAAGFVYAIEKNPADAAIAADNSARLGVSNYALSVGKAPAGLDEWPTPDAVFIGGSGGELATLIELALTRLRPGGRLVINLVTLDNLTRATSALDAAADAGVATWEMVQLQAARSRPILKTLRLAAENPVWILTATKCTATTAQARDRFAVGVGCDRGTSAASIALAVGAALAVAGIAADTVSAIASSEHKADEAGLHEFAASQGWPLHFFAASELDGVAVPNPSPAALQHAGSASVAEAAARLVAAGGDLLVGKQKYRGDDGKHVTVAIARITHTDHTTAPDPSSGAV